MLARSALSRGGLGHTAGYGSERSRGVPAPSSSRCLNYEFQFPDRPSGDRAELIAVSGLKLLATVLVAALAMAWAMYGRAVTDRWLRMRHTRLAPSPS